MGSLYLWDNDKEEILVTKSTNREGPEWAYYKYAVDTETGEDYPEHRYGIYTRGDSNDEKWFWNHIPKRALPKKFIASLFLLGIN